jgi:8-oxo-dGTP pyrophosphatase MutT (NUDIX family)
MSTIKVNNACALIYCDENGYRWILFVWKKHRKGISYMLPGGKLERNEKPWQGMKREYKEEVGVSLPKPDEVMFTKSYYRKHSDGSITKIYSGYSKKPRSWFKYRKEYVLNNETDGIAWLTLNDALTNKMVKSYVRRSLMQMHMHNPPII